MPVHTFDDAFSLHPQLHIVSMKSSLNGNVSQAIADSNGLAALGFLIDVRMF